MQKIFIIHTNSIKIKPNLSGLGFFVFYGKIMSFLIIFLDGILENSYSNFRGNFWGFFFAFSGFFGIVPKTDS